MNRKKKLAIVSATGVGISLLAPGLVAAQQDGPTLTQPPVASEDSTPAETAPPQNLSNDAKTEVNDWSNLDPLTDDEIVLATGFWDAGYNYNQLLKLSEEWDLNEFEAKVRAGQMIVDGEASEFESLIKGIEAETALNSPDLAFWESDYTIEDAQELAEEWETDDLYEAKIMIGEMVLDGRQAEIDRLLSE